VGSGKSSLLSACLGEMEKLSGRINVCGRTAYAPQLAFIQNATLRDNILFGRAHEPARYAEVLAACALTADCELLPRGDLTEIGEKGINLSGGQKQRINLARALYSDADLYLLDDSLSAVDAHVGQHIFSAVIGPAGLLRHKTRLLVTNSLHFLSQADQVLFVEGGRVAEQGAYEALLHKGSFSLFMRTYLASVEADCDAVESMSRAEPRAVLALRKRSCHPPAADLAGLVAKESTASRSAAPAVLQYFRACNLRLVAVFVLLYLLSFVAQVLSNFWLSDLSNSPERSANTRAKLLNYGLFFLLSFLSVLFVFCADFLFVWMFVSASQHLHDALLSSLLRCNLRFFESTPVGRVLNRFSKDIETVESKIPEAFKNSIRNGFQASRFHSSLQPILYH